VFLPNWMISNQIHPASATHDIALPSACRCPSPQPYPSHWLLACAPCVTPTPRHHNKYSDGPSDFQRNNRKKCIHPFFYHTLPHQVLHPSAPSLTTTIASHSSS